MKNRFFYIIIILVFSSCNNENNIKKEYYKSGALKSYYTFNKDGVKHGEFKVYYSNGVVKEKGRYCNNKLDSVHDSYYQNGKLKSFANCDNGNYIGDRAFYSEKYGITHYLYYDEDYKKRYICGYDSLHRIIKEEGRGIPLIQISDFKVKLDSLFYFTPIVVGPLYYERKLIIIENNVVTDSIILNDTTNTYTFRRYYKKLGRKNICVELEMYNSKDSIVHKHQTCVDIEVVR